MRASAILVADRPPGSARTRCTTLRSAPPLTLRATGDDLVHLVGSAAGPVGGDALRLSVTVGADCRLVVRSVAASLVMPGPTGAPSSLDVDVDVAARAVLHWLPEPTIVVRGCDHRATTHLRLATGSEVVWREIVVLGRHDEAPGSLLQRLRVDLDGAPLVRNDLPVGPLWPGSLGPAGAGDARAVATALVVGPAAAALRVDPPSGVRAAVLPLEARAASAHPAALVSVLAPHPLAAITTLEAALPVGTTAP